MNDIGPVVHDPLICVSPWALPVQVLSVWQVCEPGSCSGPGRGLHGPLVPQGSLLSIHSMQVVEILSSKALCKIQVKWEYIKEDALVSAVSNMWYLQTINIFNGFNSYFLDFFVTFYSFWRPNCYITRDGSLWSYRLLKFDKKFNRTCNQQLCLNLKISQIYDNK